MVFGENYSPGPIEADAMRAVWSNDESALALLSGVGGIQVLETSTWSETQSFGRPARMVAFSPDNGLLAASRNESVEICDLAVGAGQRCTILGLQYTSMDEPTWCRDGRCLWGWIPGAEGRYKLCREPLPSMFGLRGPDRFCIPETESGEPGAFGLGPDGHLWVVLPDGEEEGPSETNEESLDRLLRIEI